jgi:hypothetical protein
MPEGLKNTGSTFARMTKAVLGPQLQKNIIAYVNDIVVMSKNEEDHIADLKETFVNLRVAGLKLNPAGQQRKDAWVHHRTQRHKGKPRKDEDNNLNGRTINQKGHPKAHWKDSNIK